jgi:serine palmitoyltransferase
VEAVNGNYLSLKGIQDPVLNLTTSDFLGAGQQPGIKEAAEATLHKYGCGSCGPRGFYGTIDVHLDLESEIAKWTKTEESIYYSDGASAVSSTIPAFSKKGDLLIMDEACNDAIRTGADLSRSTVVKYRHNDMNHLREILASIAADDQKLKRDTSQQRRFILTEGIFQLTGTLCNFPELMKMKKEYFYRVMIDETVSMGTIGATGRGITEHFQIPISEVEMIIFGLDAAFGAVGGVCIGSHEVVDHQRLSGAGYCFSASVPPFLASSALFSLKYLQINASSLIPELALRSKLVTDFFKSLKGFKLLSKSPNFNSPILQVALEDPSLASSSASTSTWDQEESILNEIVRSCLLNGIGITTTKTSTDWLSSLNQECLRPSIRFAITNNVSLKELENSLTIFKRCAEGVLLTRRSVPKFQ